LSLPKQGRANFYRPELDALRFFAFLLVYVCHILQDAGLSSITGNSSHTMAMVDHGLELVSRVGAYGVSLFFLLSGYLITELMFLEHDRTGHFQIKSFYVRRILRIWPLYFSVLGVFVVLGWLDPASFHVGVARIVAFLALSGNWYLIARGTFPAELGVLWSISIEEQFYLMWPGIFLMGKRRGLLIACAAFLAVSTLTLAYLGIAGVGRMDAWLNSFVQFEFFAVGGLMAVFTYERLPRWTPLTRSMLVAGGLAVWFGGEAATHLQQRDAVLHSRALLLGFNGIALGAVSIFLGVQGLRAGLVPAWLRYLGKISYGLYVFHPLAVTFTAQLMGAVAHGLHMEGAALKLFKVCVPVAALFATIGVAALSYRFLEMPFLQLKRRFTVVKSRPA
jgi:peptidoglycan/LPS O-acetylase OafA/YrhL